MGVTSHNNNNLCASAAGPLENAICYLCVSVCSCRDVAQKNHKQSVDGKMGKT